MAKASARGRKRRAALAASVVAHVGVLALIGLSAPRLSIREPPRPPAVVWLMPHFALRSSSRAPRAANRAAEPILLSSHQATPPTLAPSLPAPTPPAMPPPGAIAAGSAGGAQGVGEGSSEGVRGALRAGVGCDLTDAVHLTPEEKRRCSQRVGEEARRGPKFIDPIPAEKRAYYDAIQAAYQGSHQAMPVPIAPGGAYQAWGRNPGLGCTLLRKSPRGASLADKIKATGMIGLPLGPISCGVVLPIGSLTPELGIAPP